MAQFIARMITEAKRYGYTREYTIKEVERAMYCNDIPAKEQSNVMHAILIAVFGC